MILRENLLKYAKDKYGTVPEKLWSKYPSYEVLRHESNKKWYAIIMSIQKNKVGLSGEDLIDVFNVKCNPNFIPILIQQKGFAPAYHMNKEHWITVILDGSAQDKEIYNLLDESYEMTK